MKLSIEEKQLKKGTVLSTPEPRSYFVQAENKSTERRNCVHLKPRFSTPTETKSTFHTNQ